MGACMQPTHLWRMANVKELSLSAAASAENNPLIMAVLGCAGEGKSTLVNSLLLMEPESDSEEEEDDDTADVGVGLDDSGVRCYTKCRDNASVKIWDTPGLAYASTVNQEGVISLLRQRAGDDVDLFLYCIAYRPDVKVTSSHVNIIKFLTKQFGKEFWRKVLLVFTMVNKIKERKSIPKLAKNIEKGLKSALRNADVPEDVLRNQCLILAGLGEKPLPINENEVIDWNQQFFTRCLDTIKKERKRAALTQARFGRSIWKGLIEFWETTTGNELALTFTGGVAGMGVGGVSGGMYCSSAKPITFAIGLGGTATTTGSAAGAAGASTLASTVSTGAVASTVGPGAVASGTGTGVVTAGTAEMASVVVGSAGGTIVGAAGTGGAMAFEAGGGIAAGAAGTSVMVGVKGGAMAAAKGCSAVAGTVPTAVLCGVVGALGLGLLTGALMVAYFGTRKRKKRKTET